MYILLAVVVVHLDSQGCVWVVSYDLLSDCLVIYVCLGHVYTVFHNPDLPILDPSPLIRSYIMHLLLMVYMVYLDCQGCVWVLSCDLKSDDFGVFLGHFYTVFHCPDLPRLAPSTLLSSHMMHTLLVVGMVYLDSQGCVWVVSYDLTSDDFGDIRVLRSCVHPISLPRPETHPYRPPLVLCGVHTRTSGSGVFGW